MRTLFFSPIAFASSRCFWGEYLPIIQLPPAIAIYNKHVHQPHSQLFFHTFFVEEHLSIIPFGRKSSQQISPFSLRNKKRIALEESKLFRLHDCLFPCAPIRYHLPCLSPFPLQLAHWKIDFISVLASANHSLI